MKEIKTIEDIRNIKKSISKKLDNDPRKYVEYLKAKQKKTIADRPFAKKEI